MSDLIYSTPRLGRKRCPGCEPEGTIDHRVDITYPEYCTLHGAMPRGLDDTASMSGPIHNTLEVGGESNRLMCAFLHRNRKKRP